MAFGSGRGSEDLGYAGLLDGSGYRGEVRLLMLGQFA